MCTHDPDKLLHPYEEDHESLVADSMRIYISEDITLQEIREAAHFEIRLFMPCRAYQGHRTLTFHRYHEK